MTTHTCLSPRSDRRDGFTLIELLVVVAIIALLISILLPSLSAARETARTVACSSSMKQFGMGQMMYADASDGWFVPVNASGAGVPLPEYVWAWNSKFRSMMGMEPTTLEELDHGDGDLHGAYTAGFVCPSAPSRRRNIGCVSHVYGMNFTLGYDDDRQYFVQPDGAYAYQRNAVTRPASKMQTVEANEWWVNDQNANPVSNWDVYGELRANPNSHGGGTGMTSITYRHNEGMNAQYFDGHVEYLAKDEAYPETGSFELWRIDGE